MAQVDFQITLRQRECPDCGITYGMTSTLEGNLRSTNRTFYCPNGHALSFKDQKEIERLTAEVERLKKAIDSQEERLSYRWKQIEELQRKNANLRGQITKLKARLAK